MHTYTHETNKEGCYKTGVIGHTDKESCAWPSTDHETLRKRFVIPSSLSLKHDESYLKIYRRGAKISSSSNNL